MFHKTKFRWSPLTESGSISSLLPSHMRQLHSRCRHNYQNTVWKHILTYILEGPFTWGGQVWAAILVPLEQVSCFFILTVFPHLFPHLRETKEFFLQFSFKLSDPRGGSAVARPPPPAMVPAPPKPVTRKPCNATWWFLNFFESGSTSIWVASTSNASRTSSPSSATTFLKSAPGVIAIILKSAVNFCKEQIFQGQWIKHLVIGGLNGQFLFRFPSKIRVQYHSAK